MKKKKASVDKWSKNKLIIFAVLASLILAIVTAGLFVGVYKYRYYNEVAILSSTAPTRDLILLAVRGVKKDAPVDFKTGDVYFPEAKLYLPSPDLALPLTYYYDKGNGADFAEELTVSTYPVRGTEKMYIAKNQEELFAAVPKLQSCSRGIRITLKVSPESVEDLELLHKYKLNNGDDVYVYLEKSCPELKPLAESFKTLQSY